MEDTEKSKFNMGIAMLRRVDALISEAVMAKRSYNFGDWFDNLLALVGEINFTFKDDILAQDLNYQNSIAELLNSHGDQSLLYSTLLAYEKFIKQQLAERDMLIATKEDVRQAIIKF